MTVLPSIDPQLTTWLVTALAHLLWQGTFIAGITAVLSLLWQHDSARRRYVVFGSALLMTGACLPLNLWLFAPAAATAVSGPLAEVTPTATETTWAPIQNGPTDVAIIETFSPPPLKSAEQPPPPSMSEDLAEASRGDVSSTAWLQAQQGILVAYLLGILLMTLRLLAGFYGSGRLRATAIPIQNESLLEQIACISTRLKMKMMPVVACSARVASPVIVGVLKPAILLPTVILSELTPQQIESLLRHEIAHLRRYDHWVNMLQRMIETVLFFHPAIWWLSHKVSLEREHCCDDLAISWSGDRCNYAESLVRMSELRLQGTGIETGNAAMLAATGGRPTRLRQRILRAPGMPLPGPGAGLSRLALLILTTTTVASAMLLAARPADESEEPLDASVRAFDSGGRIELLAIGDQTNVRKRVELFPAPLVELTVLDADGTRVEAPDEAQSETKPIQEVLSKLVRSRQHSGADARSFVALLTEDHTQVLAGRALVAVTSMKNFVLLEEYDRTGTAANPAVESLISFLRSDPREDAGHALAWELMSKEGRAANRLISPGRKLPNEEEIAKLYNDLLKQSAGTLKDARGFLIARLSAANSLLKKGSDRLETVDPFETVKRPQEKRPERVSPLFQQAAKDDEHSDWRSVLPEFSATKVRWKLSVQDDHAMATLLSDSHTADDVTPKRPRVKLIREKNTWKISGFFGWDVAGSQRPVSTGGSSASSHTERPGSWLLVDHDRKPIAEATIQLFSETRGFREEITHQKLYRTTTAADGSFELPKDKTLMNPLHSPGPYAAWATVPANDDGPDRTWLLGMRTITTEQRLRPELRLVESKTTIRVITTDGSPAAGVTVTPTQLIWSKLGFHTRGRFFVPAELKATLQQTTDQNGLVVFPSVAQGDIAELECESPAHGRQRTSTNSNYLGHDDVMLFPASRITGRIMASDAKSRELLRGRKLRFKTISYNFGVRPKGARILMDGLAEVTPDADGRFEIPAMAAGRFVLVDQFGRNADRRIQLPDQIRVRDGQPVNVEGKVIRMVRVRGTFRHRSDRQPVPNAGISIDHGRRAGISRELSIYTKTDSQGRFEAYVFPGDIGYSAVTTLSGFQQTWKKEQRYEPERPYGKRAVIPDGRTEYKLAPLELIPVSQ